MIAPAPGAGRPGTGIPGTGGSSNGRPSTGESGRNAPGTSASGTSASGIGIAVGGAAVQQTGAAVAAGLFPAIGVVGATAFRQIVMACVHVPLARRHLRGLTRAQVASGILLGLALGAMNLMIYLAIDRIGLGLAVTLEITGPLALAVLAGRRLPDVLCAAVAFAGVLLIARPSSPADPVGVAFGLAAAVCWAGYILATKTAGARLPGLAGSAIASLTTVAVFVPAALITVDPSQVDARVIGLGVLAGLLSSAVPYGTDLLALRRLPTSAFSMLMSIHPSLAALAGWMLLGERLDLLDVLAIALISLANTAAAVIAARTSRAQRTGADPGLEPDIGGPAPPEARPQA